MNVSVVNFSSPGSWYTKGQQRIVESMKANGYNGAFYTFWDYQQIKSPSHQQAPYAFKIYAIEAALQQGHDVVWWMDSSIYAVKDITPVLNIVEKEGYFFEKCGFNAATWTNDRTLQYFGITRDEAEAIQLFSAGFTVLDFRKEKTVNFFKQWKKSCEDGMFSGNWTNIAKTESQDMRCLGHRHDMSCASIIAHKLDMPIFNTGYLSYIGPGYGEPNKNSIFHLNPAL